MCRRGRVDADGPLVGARRRRPRAVARRFRIRHFGTLRHTEGPPSAVFDADGCGTPRDTPRMPIGASSFGSGRCRTELKSWRLRRIRCNLACQYDPEVHDDAGDTVERGWGCVGGVEWMPTTHVWRPTAASSGCGAAFPDSTFRHTTADGGPTVGSLRRRRVRDASGHT